MMSMHNFSINARSITMEGHRDARHNEAPLFEALRIQTIPANFLIDHDGKVIAKNVHGEDLRKFVEAYLK